MSSVVETVTDLVTPILQDHDFYIYDLEFVKEGKSWYLSVYIDKDGGITLEDCALVSDELSEALDNVEPDPIPQAYFLEVSSPGAERTLKKEEDYQRAIDHYIHISLYQQINGQKVYEGTLTQLSDKEIDDLVAKEIGMKVLNHEITIKGICKECMNKVNKQK